MTEGKRSNELHFVSQGLEVAFYKFKPLFSGSMTPFFYIIMPLHLYDRYQVFFLASDKFNDEPDYLDVSVMDLTLKDKEARMHFLWEKVLDKKYHHRLFLSS